MARGPKHPRQQRFELLPDTGWRDQKKRGDRRYEIIEILLIAFRISIKMSVLLLVDFDIENEEMDNYFFGSDKQSRKNISEFISKQTFNTSTLPKGIPKWVFSTWIYIEQKE